MVGPQSGFHSHISFEAHYLFYQVSSFFVTWHLLSVNQRIPEIFQAFPLCLTKWINRPQIGQSLDNLAKLHIRARICDAIFLGSLQQISFKLVQTDTRNQQGGYGGRYGNIVWERCFLSLDDHRPRRLIFRRSCADALIFPRRRLNARARLCRWQ